MGTSLEGAAVLAAGASALGMPQHVQAGSPNNTVLLALMGAGGRGMDLAKKMLAIPDVQFKYVCDVYDVKGRAGITALEKIQGSRPNSSRISARPSTTRRCMALWWRRRNTGTRWPRSGHARPAKTCTWRRTSRCTSGKAAR